MQFLWVLSIVLSLIGPDHGRTSLLPPDAHILEVRSLAESGHPNRELILWMVNPERRPSGYEAEDPYTCPDETRGSHFSGPARVSLVDTARGVVLHTLDIVGPYDSDSVDLPYLIRPGYCYHVAAVTDGLEGKPTLMRLQDYNGDRSPLEFALFDAPSCMGLQTSLIGYLPDEDRVHQFPIRVQIATKEKTTYETRYWLAYLFEKQPYAPGSWRFEVDYRGRGGVLERTAIHYNRALNLFEGVLTQIE